MLIDTHAHLNSDKFKNDLDIVISNAKNKNVKKFIVVGFDSKTNRDAILLAEKYDFIFATVGWHPVDATFIVDKDFKNIEESLQNSKVVAIGECGLDYHWDTSTKEEQVPVFKKQIELSIKYNLPLVIHTRDSIEDTFQILNQYKGKIKGVMHCYSGSMEMAKKFLDLGFYISLGGVVTFKNAKKVKEVAFNVPIDKLLLETDCPYLAPHPYRGKRNEPMYVDLICKEVANIREVDYSIIENQTTKNAEKLFGI